MGTVDTLKALNQLEKTIEEQRELQLQAHGVLTCLYEVLLHADGAEAVSYAQATSVARELVNKCRRAGPGANYTAARGNRVSRQSR